MELDSPFVSPFEYVDYLSLALAYRPTARNVLFVGLGGGSAPKRLWRDFPDVRIQAVELDPEVVDVAYRWFALPRSSRLDVVVEDGRRFLVRDERRWDAIVLDAYYADSIPFHLVTREFMQLVRERLAPGGVVVANVIGALEGENSKLFRSLYRTYRSVFPSLTVHPVDFQRDTTAVRNIIVVAAQGALPAREFLLERWNELRAEHPQAPDLARAINRRYEKFVPTRDVPILTDDYAPTDALLLVD
jgi:spermidine synthase